MSLRVLGQAPLIMRHVRIYDRAWFTQLTVSRISYIPLSQVTCVPRARPLKRSHEKK